MSAKYNTQRYVVFRIKNKVKVKKQIKNKVKVLFINKNNSLFLNKNLKIKFEYFIRLLRIKYSYMRSVNNVMRPTAYCTI